MNIQEENSARYFGVQSEREQTLASPTRRIVANCSWISETVPDFLPVSQKGPENLLYPRLSWKSFDFSEIATGVATPP